MQRNWEPHLRCVGELRLGQAGDGGKHVCDPECVLEPGKCAVLSFGSNNDFGFETSLAPYKCAIHVYDHTGKMDGGGTRMGGERETNDARAVMLTCALAPAFSFFL